jgi:Na+/proline symporter
MLELSTVVALMALYFIVCGGLTWRFSGTADKSKENFLLANRRFETVRGMFSITAAWTWATALFLAPQLSYQFGFTGFFWILGMNTLTLAIFGFAAYKIRQLYPTGFTFAEHIKIHYGRWAHNTYILAFLLIAVIALSLNIYAGSKLIETITGLNMNIAAAFLIVSAVLFSIFRGLRGTNVTEIFKMIVILATALIVVPQVWSIAGWDVIAKGMTGKTGTYGDLWGTAESVAFFLSTGIYFLFRHISLPWADNSFWQRAFVIKPEKIKRTYAAAAALFFVAPAMFATLGFVAAGSGMTIANAQLTNVAVIAQLLSPWALGLVVFMLLTALTSIIDSQITSVATLISHDVVPQFSEKVAEARSIDISRVAVIAVVALSWALVNIPGVNILYFGLLAGCICMTFFVPTLISLFRPAWIQAQSMVTGILVALTVGFPVYAYASLNKMVELSLAGFFTCLIASATITLVGSYLQRKIQ